MQGKLLDEKSRDETFTSKAIKEMNTGDKTVASLLYFNKPFSQIPIRVLINTMLSIIWETLMISVSTLGSQFMVTSGYVLLNLMDKTREQAALGIVLSFNTIFFYGYYLAMMDKLGIHCSQTFGARHYYETKRGLNQGMWVTVFVFLGFTTPCFIFSENLLKFFTDKEDFLVLCQEILLYLLGANLLEMIGDLIRSACMAQGFESIFGSTSLLAVVVAITFGFIFVVPMNLGVYGWLYSKIIYEIITLAVALTIFWITHPDTRGFISLREVSKGFGKFFCDSMKFALGNYLEFIGYELISVFIFLQNNEEQTAAYTSVLNVSALSYATGETFSVICRTRTNILIGKGMKQASKRFFMFFLIGLMIFGWAISGALFLGKNYIAEFYAGANLQEKEYFLGLLSLFSLMLPTELTITTTSIGVKTIGRITFLLVFSAMFYIFGNFCYAYMVSEVYKQGAVVLYAGMVFSESLVNFVGIILTFSTDWRKRELIIDEEDEENCETENVPDNPVIETTPALRKQHTHEHDQLVTTVNNLVLY